MEVADTEEYSTRKNNLGGLEDGSEKRKAFEGADFLQTQEHSVRAVWQKLPGMYLWRNPEGGIRVMNQDGTMAKGEIYLRHPSEAANHQEWMEKMAPYASGTWQDLDKVLEGKKVFGMMGSGVPTPLAATWDPAKEVKQQAMIKMPKAPLAF